MIIEPLVILGSARKQSETEKFLDEVLAGTNYKLIDLLDHHIEPYSYSGNYSYQDNFLKLVDEMIEHKNIVFATPVYWYAMSGLMKTFFDRITDLVTTKKHLGRKLEGRSTALIAVGAEQELPIGFDVPFKLTSEYLKMTYIGCVYHSTKFQKTNGELEQECKYFNERLNLTRHKL